MLGHGWNYEYYFGAALAPLLKPVTQHRLEPNGSRRATAYLNFVNWSTMANKTCSRRLGIAQVRAYLPTDAGIASWQAGTNLRG